MDRFVEVISSEASMRSTSGKATTVYFGGGTPSFIGSFRLAKILTVLRGNFTVADDAEITVEANPLDVTRDWAAESLGAGFNRVSIGVQSIDDESLEFLGRVHRAQDGPQAVRIARDAGFGEISIDVIYGLPGQTAESLVAEITHAIELCQPTHVSCYQLTYSSGTPLWRDWQAGMVKPLSDNRECELFMTVHETLDRLGYPAYEVSNFSQKLHRSCHNSNYWRHTPYIGLGPAAHSFSPPVRYWNVSDISSYIRALERGEAPEAGRETLTDEQLADETIMLALRTTDGLNTSEFAARFDRRIDDDKVSRLVRDKLIEVVDSRIRPTRSGLAVADALAAELAS